MSNNIPVAQAEEGLLKTKINKLEVYTNQLRGNVNELYHILERISPELSVPSNPEKAGECIDDIHAGDGYIGELQTEIDSIQETLEIFEELNKRLDRLI